MRIFNDWRGLPEDARGATIALGNFDGVHLGHATVLRAAHAARPDAPLGVLTFEPHPREVFRPDDPPFRLTLSAERSDALAALGCSLLFELSFNHVFSLMMAETFVSEVLYHGLGARHLTTGLDFAFGHRRGGDAGFLAARAEALGMWCDPCAGGMTDAGGPLSSTRIRRALQDGYPERATAELGRPWAIRWRGRAWRDQRGPHDRLSHRQCRVGPAPGAGARRLRGDRPAGEWHDIRYGDMRPISAAGRPWNAGPESRLEVNLFDFDGDIYGTEITVALIAYIRPEIRFPGLDALEGADRGRRGGSATVVANETITKGMVMPETKAAQHRDIDCIAPYHNRAGIRSLKIGISFLWGSSLQSSGT